MMELAPGQWPGTSIPLGHELPLFVSTQVPCLSKARSTGTVQDARLIRSTLGEVLAVGEAEARSVKRPKAAAAVRVFIVGLLAVGVSDAVEKRLTRFWTDC